MKLDDETRNVFESNEISCVTSGSENLFLGSFDGFVRIVSSGWKVVQSFRAHDAGAVTHMQQVEGTSLLVTVAVRREIPLPPPLGVYRSTWGC